MKRSPSMLFDATSKKPKKDPQQDPPKEDSPKKKLKDDDDSLSAQKRSLLTLYFRAQRELYEWLGNHPEDQKAFVNNSSLGVDYLSDYHYQDKKHSENSASDRLLAGSGSTTGSMDFSDRQDIILEIGRYWRLDSLLHADFRKCLEQMAQEETKDNEDEVQKACRDYINSMVDIMHPDMQKCYRRHIPEKPVHWTELLTLMINVSRLFTGPVPHMGFSYFMMRDSMEYQCTDAAFREFTSARDSLTNE